MVEHNIKAADVITAIMNGDVDDELGIIRDAVRQRERAVGEIVRLLIKPGTRVRLKNLSPKYLNGLEATVSTRPQRGKRIPVELDESIPRFGKTLNPPSQCIEVVE
jgi:hypothetical protein